LLAKNARKVIAVDNSPKMVEFASQLAKKHGFRNIEYRLGDMQEPPLPEQRRSGDFQSGFAPCSAPERAIKSAHSILRKNGRIVILDLLNHSFERARELYADHWLGFSEVQLHQFLEDSGFKNIDVRVVAREKQSPNFQTVFATGTK
jgi:ArsR family transcriptional regulator